MPTVQKEVNGQTVEVEVTSEDLPDGHTIMDKSTLDEKYVDADYHKNEIERVKGRFDSDMRSDVREELKQDESFRKEVAAEFDLDEEQRKQIVQEVEENKVEPLKDELQTWKQQTKREKLLNVMQEREDTDPKALQSIGDADPLAVQAFEGRIMETDDGRFVMTDEKGNPLPGEDGGYASISEGVDQLLETDEYQALLKEEQPSKGSNFNGSGSPRGTADDWDGMSKDQKIEHLKETGGQHPKKTN